jgi:prepilin peptidase CpaA
LIVPFIILLPLYILNMLGAGDIKLLCSIGALTGIKHVLISIVFSFIFGAVIALLIMAVHKNLFSRLRKLYIYLKCCFLSMSIMPYYQLNTDNDGKMHFTIPIALGTIAASLI